MTSTPRPVSPIELTGTDAHLAVEHRTIDDDVLRELAAICEVTTDTVATAEASRDWWPIALHWALAGEVPARAHAVVTPTTTEQVAATMAVCSANSIPVTAAGGRSGVCGGSVPLSGGVLLDLSRLRGVVHVDEVSGVVEVLSGTFGPELEDELGSRHGLSVRHLPQSFELATVGGWVACRGAGQYSTRYGKVEDMVLGLEVVLADGSIVRIEPEPAAATGPDLKQLFIGSEGTLGVMTRVWLRAHRLPAAEQRRAWWFDSFDTGVEACRRILQHGATPAVLRLYDPIETQRSHGGDGVRCALLVLDEGHRELLAATMSVVAEVCDELGDAAPAELVDHWYEHRNNTAALQELTRRGYVVDTMEIAAGWSQLAAIRAAVTESVTAIDTVRNISCHLSHSYSDGACLYFSFAAAPSPEELEACYREIWDTAQRAALDAGANLSHHHGIGLNRARFMADALGPAQAVLEMIKHQLDPSGIMNPGKLGLTDRFGTEVW